jgi:hypothetical protein
MQTGRRLPQAARRGCKPRGSQRRKLSPWCSLDAELQHSRPSTPNWHHPVALQTRTSQAPEALRHTRRQVLQPGLAPAPKQSAFDWQLECVNCVEPSQASTGSSSIQEFEGTESRSADRSGVSAIYQCQPKFPKSPLCCMCRQMDTRLLPSIACAH